MADQKASGKAGDGLDLTRGLRELEALALGSEQVERVLEGLLESLAPTIPFELAAVLERDPRGLFVRAARGGPGRGDRVELDPALARALERGEPTSQPGGEFEPARASEPGRASRPGHASKPGRASRPGHASKPVRASSATAAAPWTGRGRLLAPIRAADRTLGGLFFVSADAAPYAPALVELAASQAAVIALALQAAEQTAALESYRARLEERNRLLEGEVSGPGHAGARIEGFASAASVELARTARQVAVTDAPVLITGETGSGKEVLARAIHGWSRRARGPFVKLNCAALPEGLVESELFGHKRGAFSGATADRLGRFAVAHRGTLLLDEVGDLPAGAQAKLLRVLQEGSFEPVGSDRTVGVDVRIVAATHVDLERAIEQGRFRRDLFYRLNVLPMHVPPLRERTEDLARLAREVLADIARRTGRGPWRLSADALERMRGYRWPGNVRELVNVLERAAVLSEGGELRVHLPARRGEASAAAGLATLREVERAHLRRVLQATGGKLYGPGGAAEVLGLKPSTLQSRMRKLGVARVQPRWPDGDHEAR